MSTRCQIGVYENADDPNDKPVALLYRHSDGYPEGPGGVVKAIADFLGEFIPSRGFDAEYLAAQLMYSLVKRYRDDIENSALAGYYKDRPGSAKDMINTYKFIGHGICNGFHGDIEYFYRIDPAGVKVYAVDGDNSEAWKEMTTGRDAASILKGKVPDKFVKSA